MNWLRGYQKATSPFYKLQIWACFGMTGVDTKFEQVGQKVPLCVWGECDFHVNWLYVSRIRPAHWRLNDDFDIKFNQRRRCLARNIRMGECVYVCVCVCFVSTLSSQLHPCVTAVCWYDTKLLVTDVKRRPDPSVDWLWKTTIRSPKPKCKLPLCWRETSASTERYSSAQCYFSYSYWFFIRPIHNIFSSFLRRLFSQSLWFLFPAASFPQTENTLMYAFNTGADSRSWEREAPKVGGMMD